MSLPKELTTVTPLSKGLALSLVVFLPFITCLLGAKYEQNNHLPILKIQQKESTRMDILSQIGYVRVFQGKKFFTYFDRKTYLSSVYMTDTVKPNLIKKVFDQKNRVQAFDEFVYLPNNVLIPMSGGESTDLAIIDYAGNLITDSVATANPELKEYTFYYKIDPDKTSLLTDKITLSVYKNASESGSVKLDLMTGKIIPGTLIQTK